MKFSFLKSAILCIATLNGISVAAQEVIFHNEAADTTRITSLLIDECSQRDAGNVARIAQLFINTPYAAGTLDGNKTEQLTVNLDSLDCTTFVETAVALAYTASEHRQSWQDFVYNLRRFRYRNGEIGDYTSRLHYVSEWILDNVSRGNLKEVTSEFPIVRYAVKSLDYMTRHRDLYPALADDETYERMKNVEAGFSNHRYPYLKGTLLKDKYLLEHLQTGDIICFTTATKGLDVTHMAIAVIIDNVPRMIHASRRAGKVVLENKSIIEYVHRNSSDGIRVLRMVTD
jgi:hypothetical protein